MPSFVLGLPLLEEQSRAWLAERHRLLETRSRDEIERHIAEADALHAYLPVQVDRALLADEPPEAAWPGPSSLPSLSRR